MTVKYTENWFLVAGLPKIYFASKVYWNDFRIPGMIRIPYLFEKTVEIHNAVGVRKIKIIRGF